MHSAESGEGAEAAIGAGNDALAADDLGEPEIRSATSSGCSTKFVMLSMTPGISTLSSGILAFAQHAPFVRMPRIGGLEELGLRLCLEDDGQDRFERDIVGVRSLVVAPADVHPHALGRDVAQARG